MFESGKQLEDFIGSKELEGYDINLSSNGHQVTVTVNDDKVNGYFLLQLLYNKRIVPLRFEKIEPSLENLFGEVVK